MPGAPRARRAVLAVLAVLGAAGAPSASAGAAAVVPPPELSASAAILVQPQTGDVVYRRNADQKRPIASTTKLMTVLVALEHRRLSDEITAVPYPALIGESLAGLQAGATYTMADMLRAVLIASGNDAAESLAINIGGTRRRFVALMNERARRAGLTRTHFANPIGLDDPRNYSTATDLAKLALLVRADPFVRRVMDRPRVVLRSGPRPIVLTNRNTLVSTVPWITGMKTGHTAKAGYLLVGSGTRTGIDLVSVVMGTPSEAARNADTLALQRWGFGRYSRRTPVVAGRTVARIPIRDRSETAAVSSPRNVRVVVRRDRELTTRTRGLPSEVEGPLEQGTRLGTVEVLDGARVVARAPLVTSATVARATWWQRSRDVAGPTVLGLLAVLGLMGAASLTLRRRDSGRRGARSKTA